jgi:hypothetical protein
MLRGKGTGLSHPGARVRKQPAHIGPKRRSQVPETPEVRGNAQLIVRSSDVP